MSNGTQVGFTVNSEVTSPDDFFSGMEHFKTTVQSTGGKPFLKFMKPNAWVLGMANEPCDNALVAINPHSIRIGLVEWQQSRVTCESPLLPVSAGWDAVPRHMFGPGVRPTKKYLMEVMLLSTTTPLEAIFSAATIGAAQGVEKLIDRIFARRGAETRQYYVPHARLTSDSYMHSQWGRIFFPDFKVERWTDMNGSAEPAAKPQLAAQAARRNLI